MTRHDAVVREPHDMAVPEGDRSRVVRRRRSRSRRHHRGPWTARASRRRVLRAFVLCTSVLVLMALGLYYGLSRQDVAPVEGTLAAPTASTGAA